MHKRTVVSGRGRRNNRRHRPRTELRSSVRDAPEGPGAFPAGAGVSEVQQEREPARILDFHRRDRSGEDARHE